jgi:hypothetical protein
MPLRLLRRALRVSAWEGDLVVSFFTGACTVTIAAKEPNGAFRGANSSSSLQQSLPDRRVATLPDSNLLREIAEQFWSAPSS